MNTTSCQLFTLGYEGRPIATYQQLIQQNDIAVLCDVRKDPVSRKKGFSKNGLEKAMDSIGVTYYAMTKLGVPKAQRKKVQTKADLQQLFEWYHEEVLQTQTDTLQHLMELLRSHQRLALTCYEKDVKECHRLYVARYLDKHFDAPLKITHL